MGTTTTTALSRTRALPALRDAEVALASWLTRHSVPLLRVSMGVIFLGFGVLKFFPGVSPAAQIAGKTTEILTFGILPGRSELIVVATLECAIGLSFITGRLLRVGLPLLGVVLLGIFSSLVLLPSELFHARSGMPTLAGQYVLKDLVLLSGGLVVAATTLGARLVIDRSGKRGP